jgi:signal transduction histidine kinase
MRYIHGAATLGVYMGATRIGCVEAADLRLRLGRSRVNDIRLKCRQGLGATPLLGAMAVACGAMVGLQARAPLAFRNPELRAMIETAITLSALAAGTLFAFSFAYRRRVRDLLLAAALLELGIVNLVSYVLPAAADATGGPGLLMGGPMVSKVFAAATLAAALAFGERRAAPGRGRVAIALAASIGAAALAELLGLLLRHQLGVGGGIAHRGLAAAAPHPVGLGCALFTGIVLITAAALLAHSPRRSNDHVPALLAPAMALLAASQLEYLALPAPGIGWVTAREALRVTAYGLIMAAAVRQEVAIRRAIAQTAAEEERRRIARDLHDGLAQDLAFIAAHGARIAGEAGEDHPLAIAARRALAVSRGAIADLSAADAPSARTALRHVADELETRFGVHVEVSAEDADLPRAAREDVVRIVREAIVNAAHGGAHNIAVSLRQDDSFILRVRDDGVGITSGPVKARPGFGLRSMRERAGALGGRLTTRPAVDGGTEVEVVFP